MILELIRHKLNHFKSSSINGKIFLCCIVQFIQFLVIPPQLIKAQEIDTYLNSIDSVLKNSQVVGIGEATHGDHESQVFRLNTIKRGIEHYNFRIICIEETDYNVSGIARLLDQRRKLSRAEIEYELSKFDYWLWKTVEFVDILSMVNTYNVHASVNDQVKIVGVDTLIYGNERDSFMARNVLNQSNSDKGFFLAHSMHISKSKNGRTYAGYYLKNELKSNYYALGIPFYSGKFFVHTNKGFTHKDIGTPKKSNKILTYLLSQNLDSQFIDFNSIDLPKEVVDSLDVLWGIGASYNKKNTYHYYRKSLLSMFDGIYFVEKSSPSKNFIWPGVVKGRLDYKFKKKDIRYHSKDSVKICCKYTLTPFDTFANVGLNIYVETKKSRMIIDTSTYDYFVLDPDTNFFSLKTPFNKRVKEFTFYFYFNGQLEFQLIDLNLTQQDRIVYSSDENPYKFKGGQRFRLVSDSDGVKVISNLNQWE